MTARNLRRLLAAGAVAGALMSPVYVVGPAWAADNPGLSEIPVAGTAPQQSSHSGAALDEAVQRDLGMTPAEFAAAGKLGIAAAEVASRLQDVPGYSGLRLKDGHIVVSGSGPELLAEVAVLSGTVPEITFEDTATQAGTEASQGAPGQAHGVEVATSTGQLFKDYLRRVGPHQLQSVASSGEGFVIRTETDSSPETGHPDLTGAGKISPAQFVAGYTNVELQASARLTPETNVLGGLGFSADNGEVCSTGYSAFDPTGLPVVLTAGHCTGDGKARNAWLKSPVGENGGLIGTFGFSQFGGPDNSNVSQGGHNVGTDVAVLESVPPGLDLQPAATTWGSQLEPEPDVKIVGTALPVVGMEICRSGWRTGWKCGYIDEVGIQLVRGPNHTTGNPDIRAFSGFRSFSVESEGGDSGGPWINGDFRAVGLHAAGEDRGQSNVAVAATLSDALAVLPGYQLELFLNKPVVTFPAPGAVYGTGQAVSGNIPVAPASAIAAGSSVRITVEGNAPFEVPVDANGGWSFAAPEGKGPLKFTAETVNGFSSSGASRFEFAPTVTAEPEQPAPPAPEKPGMDSAPAHQAGTAPLVPPVSPGSPPAAVVDPPDVVDPPVDAKPPVGAGLATTGGNADRDAARLAYTGPSALLPAAGAAATAIVVGSVLMVLVRRRTRKTPG